MRTGISLTVGSSDLLRLEKVVRDRGAAQKHVWRAAIIILSADNVGTHEIMRRTGKSKTCVWRWQERFMEEGVAGCRCRGAGLMSPDNHILAIFLGAGSPSRGLASVSHHRRIDGKALAAD